MSKFNFGMKTCGLFLLWATTAVVLPAQTNQPAAPVFNTLFSFDVTNGSYPTQPLVQGTGGKLFGTTSYGGATNRGTVFNLTRGGALTTLFDLCPQGSCSSGSFGAGITQGTNGDFYGTAMFGGGHEDGAIFTITPGGVLTTLYEFSGIDGASPFAGLIQANDGNFYGTTIWGGSGIQHCDRGVGKPEECGTIFKITPDGNLTNLYNFCSQSACTDGSEPYGNLVQGTDGNFYGTTLHGGNPKTCSFGCGTVFKITASGNLTTLYAFGGQDGGAPFAGLVQGTDGNFYGTTDSGGIGHCGIGCGTVYRITPAGALTVLHSFCLQSGCPDGETPNGILILGTDGNFYGVTASGGAHAQGTIYEITPGGNLTTLYNICSKAHCTGGGYPEGGLMQDTDGKLDGTTYAGGPDSAGTVFSLSVGLGPFVKTLPVAGETGATVYILGTDLTGATSVTFNGTVATFTVVSASEITTTVPTGATTGTVQVVTPGGTLSSSVPFRVN